MAADIAKLSADRGYFRGLVQFAEYLENGIGVALNPVEAKALLARAHSREFADDQNDFAAALFHGKGCRVRKDEALKSYKISSDNGSIRGSFNLALRLQLGKDIPRDLTEAARLFKICADFGDSRSHAHYADCLLDAQPHTTDLPEAISYLRKGVEMGDIRCAEDLAETYRKGRGVKKDLPEACVCYRKAVDLGSERAPFLLAGLLLGLNRNPQELEEALRLAGRAEELGDPSRQRAKDLKAKIQSELDKFKTGK
jgi:TPR repeat protein